MKRSIARILAVSVVGLLSMGSWSFANAATYHVRQDGNDTTCNGSANTPATAPPNCAFRTVQKGVNTARAGDTVTVHAGDYTSPIPTFVSAVNGTVTSLVIIQAAAGETVSISRATITHSYNVVAGFRITASGVPTSNQSGIQINGDHNQALSNTILGNCRADGTVNGNCAAIGLSGSFNTVSSNTIDGLNNGANTSFCRAFYIAGSSNEITSNLVKDTNSIERVFELLGVANHIANNEVRNVLWTIGNGSHPDIFQVFGSGPSRDHIIENNYFHDFAGQIGNLETDDVNAIRDWTFRNNVFANIAMEFFIHIPNVMFYNNTFYRVTTTNTGWPIYACYPGGSAALKNNAFIACGINSSTGWYNCATPGAVDYNFVSNTATGGTKSGFSETHGVNGGNPQLGAVFNDCAANACDFHIGATSALIDRGTVIAGYSTGKDGNARTAPWDIGSYEFTTGTTRMLNAPQALRTIP